MRLVKIGKKFTSAIPPHIGNRLKRSIKGEVFTRKKKQLERSRKSFLRHQKCTKREVFFLVFIKKVYRFFPCFFNSFCDKCISAASTLFHIRFVPFFYFKVLHR